MDKRNTEFRLARLTKLLDIILLGKQTINPQNGPLFLGALSTHPDPATCISRLITAKTGLPSLQSSMRFDLSEAFLNGLATDFIMYIQAPELQTIAGGSFLQQVIIAMVEPPIFWAVFSQAFQAGTLQEKGQLSFAWLLLQLVSMSQEKATPYREFAQSNEICARLLSSPRDDIQIVGRKIAGILATLNAPLPVDSDFAPGGRHDNDFVDFREISIVPTAEEIKCPELPFLRPSSVLEDPETEDDRVAIYLDNQFRLLREDMIYEMREELQIALGNKKRKHRGFVVEDLVLLDIFCGPDARRCKWGLTFKCKNDLPCFKSMKGKDKPQARKAFLQQSENRKILKHLSLSCLIVNGEVAAFPTVYRDEDLLSQEPPIIVLQFDGETSTTKTLLSLKQATSIKIIQINTALFAYEPVLKALQTMTTVPLSSELLMWGEESIVQPPSSQPTRLVTSLEADPYQDLRPTLGVQNSEPLKLDKSQASSLLSSLKQRVSLIQGPPGTGKSFIGALLAKALHDFTEEIILVVCYTNHALDQFLEDLLNIGIPASSIVRLGSKSNARITPLNLQNQNGLKVGKSPAEWKEIDALKNKSETLIHRLNSIFDEYKSSNVPYDGLLAHIEFEDHAYFQAFYVPNPQCSDTGMLQVGKKGRAVDSRYLINQWERGWDAGIFKNAPHVLEASRIWRMSRPERQACINRWKFDLLKDHVAEFYTTAKAYNDCREDLDRKFGQRNAAVLKSKRIIGCTTTAAAKYSAEIRAASPGILLVEEAGEILESHILTALGENTKQLILIGDHKQLRPKVNHYQLTVEKGAGYDLNRSLFERLVLKGYPHHTLSQQHRMRPEISALVRRLTYPDLVDAARTKGRPDLRGIRDNLVFINHSSPEDDMPELADRRDLNSTSSKQNTYEAEMVLKIVRYLAQQGYGTDKLVILTPYLGQLHKLRGMLKEDNDPILNDLDSYDLVRAGLLPAATAQMSKRPIRLATIDNYQGEESDIVIVSLCRSNPTHDIGFMFAPERLNVLLSRARNALIMIGNADTFLHARKGSELWGQLFNMLKHDQHVYDGLPVRCERHPSRTALLHAPSDFDDHVPDGGCQEPCDVMLNCNVHRCPSKCHQLYDHSKMPCEYAMTDLCSKGHPLSWKCHKGRPLACVKCDREAKIAEKKQQEAFALQQKRDADDLAHAKRMAELDEQMAGEMQKLKDAQLAEERANAIRQKEKDVASIADRVWNGLQSVGSLFTSAGQTSSGGSTPALSTPVTSKDTKTSNPDPAKPSAKSPAASRTAPASSAKFPTISSGAQLTPKESPSEREWIRRKTIDGASNDAIDAIMEMTGLEDVKSQVLRIKDKIDLAQRQNQALKERFNAVLLGNPGTGKTTVARHYSKLLTSLQILPGAAFVETTGARLANDGVNGIKKHIEEVKNAGGGAIFVDEAYQLTGEHNFQGGQVLDFLLAEMENNVGMIVFILAGYNKQMEKFFEHNPGLDSRVPYKLRFADYEDPELLLMFERMVKKKYQGQMQTEEGFYGLYCRIAVRRLGRGRGREGFGNARALENMLCKIGERQAERIGKERQKGLYPDDFMLSKEDLIGPEPSTAVTESPAWKKLQSLTGLTAVKNSVKNLLGLIVDNYKRELLEQKPQQVSLNRVFLGSPGTGKTTVAKLYGQILLDLGLLSNGEVVMKNPADFVGSVLGESESKTKAILASTAGKVLIIDEAYMLYGGRGGTSNQNDIYKTAVIDTIVAEVQSTPGEDRCVLLLGYKEQIVEMFQNVNEGLARRFDIEGAFHFEDFTDAELLEILDLKLKDQDLAATDSGKKVAIEVLSRARNRPNFGNAGEVENLLTQAKLRYRARQSSLPAAERSLHVVFECQDFDPNFDRDSHASTNLQKLFEDVVGCEDIVAKLGGFQETARKMKARNMDPRDKIPTNFIMKGPPGTGKTTTARKIGQVYYDMGFLSSTEVVECSASDLVGQYVGQTGPKTKKLLEKTLGRVLFVDEAYRLGDGPFAKEAVDELVSILTQPRFIHKIVVILAGYDREMNQLLAINTGLSSRFPEEIIFKNMSPAHCLEVLKKSLSKQKIRLEALYDPSSTPYHDMEKLLEELSELPSWGNARDVGTLAKQMTNLVFTKLPDDDEDPSAELTLGSDDALACMRSMLKDRRERCTNISSPSRAHTNLQQMQQMAPLSPPPPPAIRTTQAIKRAAPPPQPKKKQAQATPSAQADARDPGVTDAVWRRLQADKRAAEAAEKQARDLRRKLEQEIQAAKKRQEAEQARIRKLEAEARAKEAAERAEIMRKLEEARLREVQARIEQERKAAILEARRREEEQRRKQEAQAQAKLRQMGKCVAGFQWIKQTGGYRCAGGSHFVSDAQLGM